MATAEHGVSERQTEGAKKQRRKQDTHIVLLACDSNERVVDNGDNKQHPSVRCSTEHVWARACVSFLCAVSRRAKSGVGPTCQLTSKAVRSGTLAVLPPLPRLVPTRRAEASHANIPL